MSQGLVVRPERDLGLILLDGQRPGPAGDAGVNVESGISCRFDAIRPGRVTTLWIDTDLAPRQSLAALVGSESAKALLAGQLPEGATVTMDEQAAMVLSRLAFLDLSRTLPTNAAPADAWSLEEAVLWDELSTQGFQTEDRAREAIGAAIPSLRSIDPESADEIQRAALALAIRLLPGSVAEFPQLQDLQVALSKHYPTPMDFAELDRPLTMMSQMALVDTLWVHLKSGQMSNAEFSGVVAVETYVHEGTARLKISIPRPVGSLSPLFVRCIDEASPELPITFADAMSESETHYVSEADAPDGFDLNTTRIEVLASLNIAVLEPADHVVARAQQWAHLALRSTRFHDDPTARRQWLFSAQLYAEAGELTLADSANEMSASPQETHPTMWAETNKAKRRLGDGV